MTKERKVIRTDTGQVEAGATGETGPFPHAQGRGAGEHHAAETESLATTPPPRPRQASGETGQTIISELRDLCEAALLAPLDSPTSDPMAALELRAGRVAQPREPGTASRIADELVRRIKSLPQLRARVVAQLLSDSDSTMPAGDAQAAQKELRAVRNLLDNLGCPRSEDDRNLPTVERIRWLLDILTATNRAKEGQAPTRRFQLGDNTPATGAQKVIDPDMR